MGDANQIDVLRARVFASMPSKQRLQPRPVVKQAEDEREEGELSSSDDDQVLPSSLPGTLPLRGQPLNASKSGVPLQVVFKDKIHSPGNTSSSNVLKTEVALLATNISIVNKSQLLSGLSATAPLLGSIKGRNEAQKDSKLVRLVVFGAVGTSNLGPPSHTQGQFSVTDLDSARQHGTVVQLKRREINMPQAHLHGPMKKLSPAALVYTPKENGSSAGQPLTQGKKRGRSVDTVRVSQGNIGLPPAASPRASSPLLGAMFSSSGSPLPPVPALAVRTEADAFLAGLVLPVTPFSNSSPEKNFIIKFDDSDSDGEQQQLEPTQGQSSYDQARAGSGKSSSHTKTPSDMFGRREQQIADMQQTKMKTNVYTKAGSSASKPTFPRTVDQDLETLRQRIAAKENELQEQRNRVKENKLQERRNRVVTGAVAHPQPQVKALGQRVEDKLGLNTASKTSFKRKPGLANAAYLDPSPSGLKTNEPDAVGLVSVREVVRVGMMKVDDAALSGSASNNQAIKKTIEVCKTAGSEANVTVSRVEPTSPCNNKDAKSPLSRAGDGVGSETAGETSIRRKVGHGVAAASMEPGTSAIRVTKSANTGLASVPANEHDLSKVGNGHKVVDALKITVTGRSGYGISAATESAVTESKATVAEPTSLPNISEAECGVGLASQMQGVGLGSKRPASVMEPSSDQHKNWNVDLNSTIPLQHTHVAVLNIVEQHGKPVSKDTNLTIAPSLHGANMSTKRQRTDEPLLPVPSSVGSAGEIADVKFPCLVTLPERVPNVGPCPADPQPSVVADECIGGSKNGNIFFSSKVPVSTLGSLMVAQSCSQPQKCTTSNSQSVAGTAEYPLMTKHQDNTGYHVEQCIPSDPIHSSWSRQLPARAGQNVCNPSLHVNSQPASEEMAASLNRTPEAANTTQSRISPLTQGSVDRQVTMVKGAESSFTPLQPTQIISRTEAHPVVTSSTAGVQVLQSTSTPSSAVRSMRPDTISLLNNYESTAPSPNLSGCGPWPSLQQFPDSGGQLEQMGMQGNSPRERANYSLQQLQEEEDTVDKALEEAQIKRRQCEFREREARRAYREAQVALISANALCDALSQRRKLLSAQVHTAEYQMLQQRTFSIHSNSLVPFNNGPRITELSSPAYCLAAWDRDQQMPGQELELGGLQRSILGKDVHTKQESGLLSPAPDQQMNKGSPRSVDTVILEEDLDGSFRQGVHVSGVQMCRDTPGSQEVAMGCQDTEPQNVEAPEFNFCIEVELSASRNSESAPQQRLADQRHTEVKVPSDASLQGMFPARNVLDLQDLFHKCKVLDSHESSMPAQESFIELSGSRSRGHTTPVPMMDGQVEVDRAGSVLEAESVDPQGLPSSSLSVGKQLVEQQQTGEGFGNVVSAYTNPKVTMPEPCAGLENAAKINDTTDFRTRERKKTSDQETFKVPQVQRQDLSLPTVLSSGDEEGLATEAHQDMKVVNAEDDKDLQARQFSSGSPDDRPISLQHESQDESGGKNQEDTAAEMSLTTRAKSKREISGLKALADDHENQQVFIDGEETKRTDYQAAVANLKVKNRADSILDTNGSIAQHWKLETHTEVQPEIHTMPRQIYGEEGREKGDSGSRTSISSEGETRSFQEGEEGRGELHALILGETIIDATEEVGVQLTNTGDLADNHLGIFATQGNFCMDGEQLLDGPDEVTEEDQSGGFGLKQLPSTVLSVGFSFLENKSSTALCLGFNQVEGAKGSEQSIFRLDTYESPLSMFRSYRVCSQFQTAWHKSLTSQTWSHQLDPCKPLCKFEHRGKCNNDACPWQHVADYTLDGARLLVQLSKYKDPDQHIKGQGNSAGAVTSALTAGHSSVGAIISNKSLLPQTLPWNRGSPVPIYKIGSYLIDRNEGVRKSRVRCCLGNYFKFSPFSSYKLSSAIQRPVHPDMPCLPTSMWNGDSQATAADASGWRYTGDSSLAATEEHVVEEPGDIEAWLELALTRIDFDLNHPDMDAYNEALYVLSRALEANPTVATLWVVYIGLFYQGKSEIGNDDLFFHAINNSKGSYELLLLYINSRTTLADRLEAYALALQTLTAHIIGSQEELSACVLDVVMQMLDCLCVAKVTPQLHTWADDFASTQGMSDPILACLTSEDCCIMRVACAYAVTFGYLPQDFLLRVGCKQQLPLELDWDRPSQIQDGSKELTLKLMQAGMSCVSVSARQESQQAMAVNYVQCLVLYHGIDHALRIGRQLKERHPNCLELVLLVVRMEGEQGWMEVFKQAVHNWPKESAGRQRLWHQYAVHMLQAEDSNAALHVLHQCATAASWSSHEGTKLLESSSSPLEFADATRQGLQLNARRFEKADGSCILAGQDAVFAWMNIALFESLSGNKFDAQVALEKSMKAAVRREDARHCWKEMAAFSCCSKGGIKQASCCDLLDRCCVETRLLCKLTPLSRGLPGSISKRRVRLFVESLIGPAPMDYSLVNSMVETIIGKEPILTKDVALIIEAVLDALPGNVELVSRFCRLLAYDLHSTTDLAAAVWASSLLLGSLLQACPQAHEQDWVEAGHLLAQLQDKDSLRSFFQFALSLHPFSATLRSSSAHLQTTNEPNFY